jgi:plasmid stability protein
MMLDSKLGRRYGRSWKALMTITVDITPEVEAALARQAAAHGRAVEAHVASLLEEAVHLPLGGPPQDRSARSKGQRPPGRKSLAQLFAESPFRGLDLDFERDRDLGRDVEL